MHHQSQFFVWENHILLWCQILYQFHYQVCTCLIPAKNQSWTQHQDQACMKVFKSTQYQDDLIYSKVSTRPTTLVHIVSWQTISLGQIWCTQSLLTSILPPNLLFSTFEQRAFRPTWGDEISCVQQSSWTIRFHEFVSITY
jgi:hypothetical protein